MSSEGNGSRPAAVRDTETRGQLPTRGSVFGQGNGSGQAASRATGRQRVPPPRGAVIKRVVSEVAASFSSSS